ncbi:MAG: c-type cytochrome [Saprospirales bacterium]|jgi:cytochrome c oxidase cbb3-type subunit 3|nr:c-type cytochrome [Saprospirales bacterium]MBK8923060.1 c-type cytochrome [Saprospirales bacterium]
MKFTKYLFTLFLLSLAATVWGQAATAPAPDPAADQLPRLMTYILVIAAAALFIVAMVYVVNINQFLYRRVLDLEASKSGVKLPGETAAAAVPVADSFWTTLRKKYWEDAVPIEREHEILSHHDFDGIRELDNRLPPWWVNLFLITIVWAGIYMYYYHWGGNGPSSTEEYKMETEQAQKQQTAALAGIANDVDESNVVALTEGGALGEGELIFKNTCAACHGQLGEGTVGPNMTDEYWVHGGGIKNIFKTIKYGVPDKGMIAWQSQLSASDMQKVASYILTLQGTNPPNPKAPQGEIWKGEAPADSTATPAPQTGTGG